ncbi:hypothetical protein CFIMG_005828RA [Ceratocystis fimbriata CBS 114723]|uniref:Uncharacterized protein n=1 Tax=Ceratocystis fimbriata CBS 114723 TaxID=1035309 RepID=A0A2C5X3U6_9PEZI|nr:hypothetical protein CFIMG_005828RA [Ceratocystis fimbriata CBS 114723]
MSQDGADGKLDLDIINFEASDNTSVPFDSKHDPTDNEIDWEDHKESASEQQDVSTTQNSDSHIVTASLLTPESKINATVEETEATQDLASTNPGNDNSEQGFENEISYELEIEADNITMHNAPTIDSAECEENEENEIDYEDNIEEAENDAVQLATSTSADGLEVATQPGPDESFDGEAPNGALVDQEFPEPDATENASMIVHGDLTIADGQLAADDNDQSGVSLDDDTQDGNTASQSHADDEQDAAEHESADASPIDDEDDDGFPTSSIDPDITVRYNGEEYPLFHGQNNIDTQMGFFHDTGVLDVPMDDVFSSFRNELSDDLDENEELVLQIDDLGLQYGESTNPDILSSVTLRQLYSLLAKLAQNQDPSSAPTMYTYLNTRLNSTRRLAYLLQEAYSGSSLESVAHRFPQEIPSEPSVDDADEDMDDVDIIDDDECSEGPEDDEDEQENEEQDEAAQEEYNDQSAEEEGDEGEDDENQEDEEDEIPADDLDMRSQQTTAEQHHLSTNEQYDPNESLDDASREEYLDFASGAGNGDSAHDDATLVQSETGQNELYLDEHEDGGVSVDNAEFLAYEGDVGTSGLELDNQLEVSLDSASIGESFDATNFSAADVDVGADLDTFFDINGEVVKAEPVVGETQASVASSATEHGDEITYDEDDDDNAGVALNVEDTSSISQSNEINDQGKRLRSEEEDLLEDDESDAKRIRS